jgi:60 kDa SS-A/Ro ribonucleoprotein
MARTNIPAETKLEYTHGGARASLHLTKEMELRRAVMACLLWEKQFYESGVSIASRIAALVPLVHPEAVASLAVEARSQMNLRHVPLLLVREMARHKSYRPYVAGTLYKVIQRADELAEFMAIYWADGKVPIAAGVKKGLAAAFAKFDAYQLAKYNRDYKVKLRDVMFLTHPEPNSEEQALTWKALADGTLPSPDTWEVGLSSGEDKREVFTRLLKEKKLGGMALLRNLRNMAQANVDANLIRDALASVSMSRVLPFRFISAAMAAPRYEDAINAAMWRSVRQLPRLSGKTLVVIDVSGSMYHSPVSRKSDIDRARIAATLGAILREVCDGPVIYATAGNDSTRKHKTELVPSRRGAGLVEAIYKMCAPLGGGGIFLTPVSRYLKEQEQTATRTIVITDEQDCAVADADSPDLASPLGRGYLINVSSYKNGIGYGKWVHIDGWSDAVVRYITTAESANGLQ